MNEARSPEDLIPVVRPAYGAETARVVLNIIEAFPDLHYQGDFEYCGTKRCIGGWAQFIHEGKVNWSVESHATEYLGISPGDADYLFYTMEEDKAVAALRYLADGCEIDWDALKSRDDWRMKETANG